MKQLLFAIATMATVGVSAQSDKYTSAMEKNLAQFDSVKTTAENQALSSAFERIGDAEKTKWLPYYYAALALTTPGWLDPKLDKDANSTKINSLCDKAEALAESNEEKSEVSVIRNMSATQQMMVDPMTRWQNYGKAAGEALARGLQLNPNNPRLYYLQGMSLFNTPAQFGGSKEKAKKMFEKAIDLYGKEQPKPMYPKWGKKQTEEQLAKCG